MSIEQIERSILVPNELDMALLNAQLARLSRHQIDFADLYFQNSVHESWVLEDGIVKDGSYNIEQGVGVRAVSGEKTGFAYSDELTASALDQAVGAARGIAEKGGDGRFKIGKSQIITPRYMAVNPLDSLTREQKIELLQQMDAFARSLDSAVSQVIVSISGVYEEILVLATDGTLATDLRPLVRLNCSVLVERNGRRERGGSGGGARLGYDYFLEEIDGQPRAMSYVKEAVRQALVNLEAIDAPAGSMPVVLGAGWPGVLLHEAVGHGLEGDFNRKGSSAYAGRIGEKVASRLCTIVDDGTLSDRRGSLSVDDEGTPGAYNVLIENGILNGYMQDKLNARLMDMAPTGNGRRESYAHLPMPRMTNTYMLAGESAPEDIIKSVKKGIYAPNFGGGQVDITSGRFVFSASEAYLIEDGKITAPIKGATLIGNGPEAMSQVSMVGNDLALDAGVGVCGKEGQSVPVGVGQPTLKLDQLTVGGTQ
ncbi:metalloprotease TldD [Oceanisphaera avium]|uniref:Metalloprotease TldD n=1 Tax=Oceanisphaera avium TaxID=1903694 RepID=A0A1Y0CZP9_9GAMM|nr:metalloprotease TldD [Oceanisphaera avium]ART80803.1 metalloprotease TldD [Oceanisphaera avium]